MELGHRTSVFVTHFPDENTMTIYIKGHGLFVRSDKPITQRDQHVEGMDTSGSASSESGPDVKVNTNVSYATAQSGELYNVKQLWRMKNSKDDNAQQLRGWIPLTPSLAAEGVPPNERVNEYKRALEKLKELEEKAMQKAKMMPDAEKLLPPENDPLYTEYDSDDLKA